MNEVSSVQTKLALQHIQNLFHHALKVVQKNPQLAQRYIQIVRRITMRTKVRLPKVYRRLICNRCKSFIVPGVNCRVRIQQKREPHIVITCFICMQYTRIPIKEQRTLVYKQ